MSNEQFNEDFDDTYDEYGVNTKNSFNTPPKEKKMQTYIVQDHASGDIYTVEATSLLNAMSEVLGNMTIDVMEESEFASENPEIYADFKEESK